MTQLKNTFEAPDTRHRNAGFSTRTESWPARLQTHFTWRLDWAAGLQQPEAELERRRADVAKQGQDSDRNKGAIEGDRPGDEQQGNPNVPALDGEGLPVNDRAIAEDRIGANIEDAEVSNADEAGRTTETPRDELDPLD
jgi:hypothetical protein